VYGMLTAKRQSALNDGGVAAGAAPAAVLAAVNTLRRLRSGHNAWDDSLAVTAPDVRTAEMLTYRSAWNVVAAHHTRAFMVPPPPPGTPPAPACTRLVVSMSTIPSRIHRLGRLLRSLKSQAVQPDAVLVGIPAFATRLRQFYTVPDDLRSDPLVTIVPLPADFGPLTKLLAALLVETDPATCIVTVDDDAEPPDDKLQSLVSWLPRLPTAAVGFGGWNKTCIVGTHPYYCPTGAEIYLFVRQVRAPYRACWLYRYTILHTPPTHAPTPPLFLQAVDDMCYPENLQLYGGRDCITDVFDEPRGAEVLMGSTLVVYRRGMFGDDFWHLPRMVARNKLLTLQGDLEEELEAAAATANATANTTANTTTAAAGAVDAGAAKDAAGNHSRVAAIDGNATRVLLAATQTALANPLFHDIPDRDRFDRIGLPDELFMVDDIYISAYLARRGVPRVVVPDNITALGMPPSPPTRRIVPDGMAVVDDPTAPVLGDVNSLHELGHFNVANYIAARFLRMLGWW